MQEDSVFTKIIKGEIPSYKLYEDELTIAILTIEPVYPGHTLVISKKQVEHFLDLPREDYDAIWETVRQVGIHIREVMGKEFIGVGIKGTDVPHVHVHLMPFDKGEEKSDKDISVASHEELKAMHDRLSFIKN